MALFFGRVSVLADLRLHRDQAGLVTSGTLTPNGGTAVPYANVCLWPPQETTGLGSGGPAIQTATITAWRVGETARPQADDSWTVGGVEFLILNVSPRHNHDEASGYAIYDCTCKRAG